MSTTQAVSRASLAALALIVACSSNVVLDDELPAPPPVAGTRTYLVSEVWIAGARVAVVRAGCSAGLVVGLRCGADTGGDGDGR